MFTAVRKSWQPIHQTWHGLQDLNSGLSLNMLFTSQNLQLQLLRKITENKLNLVKIYWFHYFWKSFGKSWIKEIQTSKLLKLDRILHKAQYYVAKECFNTSDIHLASPKMPDKYAVIYKYNLLTFSIQNVNLRQTVIAVCQFQSLAEHYNTLKVF